jgi:hypothetical protein
VGDAVEEELRQVRLPALSQKDSLSEKAGVFKPPEAARWESKSARQLTVTIRLYHVINGVGVEEHHDPGYGRESLRNFVLTDLNHRKPSATPLSYFNM